MKSLNTNYWVIGFKLFYSQTFKIYLNEYLANLNHNLIDKQVPPQYWFELLKNFKYYNYYLKFIIYFFFFFFFFFFLIKIKLKFYQKGKKKKKN